MPNYKVRNQAERLCQEDYGMDVDAFIRTEHSQGTSAYEIGFLLGVHGATISRWAKNLGLRFRQGRSGRPCHYFYPKKLKGLADLEKIRKMKMDGCTLADIASEVGISISSVHWHLRKMGLAGTRDDPVYFRPSLWKAGKPHPNLIRADPGPRHWWRKENNLLFEKRGEAT